VAFAEGTGIVGWKLRLFVMDEVMERGINTSFGNPLRGGDLRTSDFLLSYKRDVYYAIVDIIFCSSYPSDVSIKESMKDMVIFQDWMCC
jgi:hypothetical protein